MKAKHLLAAGCLLAAPFVLLAPGQTAESKKALFAGRNFAHRGLHSEDQSVPENSLRAFALAAEAGYGMELDVQLSKDGQVVVFHDDTLDRVCGVASRVDELDCEALKELSLFGTQERIPLFSEVLELVNGRTPLIVELKNGPRNDELCEKTWELLRPYPGVYCIESFNPLIVAWFRFHAPTVLRGQLAQLPEEYVRGGRKIAEAVVLGNTLLNAAARPQFIAYRIGPKPLAVRFAEALGAMAFGWTSHSRDSEAGRDAVIFEYYRPDVRFK